MPLTYGTTCTSVSDLSLRLGDRLDGLALSGLLSLSLSCWTVTFFCVLFLGALKGCMTCLFIVVYFFASATTTLDNTRTRRCNVPNLSCLCCLHLSLSIPVFCTLHLLLSLAQPALPSILPSRRLTAKDQLAWPSRKRGRERVGRNRLVWGRPKEGGDRREEKEEFKLLFSWSVCVWGG
jgi:hypothetical protein